MKELEESEEFPTQKTVNTFVGNVACGRFEKAFRDKDYYLRFMDFVKGRGLVAGAFVVNLPFEDGTVWFKYQIGQEFKNGKRKYRYEGIAAYLKDENDYEVPDECEGCPVWWVNSEEIKIR